MVLIAEIRPDPQHPYDGSETVPALSLNVNGEESLHTGRPWWDDQCNTWHYETNLPLMSFPMKVLGSDNHGGCILQDTETQDLYFVQTIDLDFIHREE